MEDPYATLGVSPTAGRDEIHRAWLSLARLHHPDRGGDAAAMQAVNEAWAVLGDPARRRAWDEANGVGGRRARASAWAADGAGGVDAGFGEGGFDPDLDLLDPRPLTPPHRSAFDLAPAGLFALAVVVGCLALALDAPPLLGFAAFLFFLSCLAVVAAAMLSMRRSVRAGRR